MQGARVAYQIVREVEGRRRGLPGATEAKAEYAKLK